LHQGGDVDADRERGGDVPGGRVHREDGAQGEEAGDREQRAGRRRCPLLEPSPANEALAE
jgi:hypothetical protein